jgi:hypothetical protein
MFVRIVPSRVVKDVELRLGLEQEEAMNKLNKNSHLVFSTLILKEFL